MSITRQNVGTLMSSAVIHGDTVYLQGLTGEDASADIKGQTQSVLDRIDARLAEAGSNKSKILSRSRKAYKNGLKVPRSRP